MTYLTPPAADARTDRGTAQGSHPSDPGRATGLRPAFAQMFGGGVLGKALGFAREIALATSFGTSSATAAFRAAHTATIIPTHYFSADALNGSFIPLCTRYLRDDPPRARTLFWSVFALISAIALVIAGLLFTGAPLWAAALVPGLSASEHALTAGMLRAMALGVPFYVIASLTSYVEMAAGRYFIGSIRAAVQNVGLIAGIAAATWTGNPLLLGWGFTVYAALFALIGLGSIRRCGLVRWPTAWDWAEASSVLSEFMRIARPLLLLPLVQLGALAAERVVASFIGTGAVASLDYARTISDTGLALLAVPLGMAGLAELGRMGTEAAHSRLERLLPAVLLVTVPASVFLALNAEPVVRLLFARGRFDDAAVSVTAVILFGFALGFWAQVGGYVLARVLIAQSRNREVATLAAAATAVHIATNLVFWRAFGPLTLGIATSVSGVVLLGLTVRSLGLGRVLARSLVPLAGGALLYIPIGLALRGDSPLSLFVAAAAFAVFWLAVLQLAPGLRSVALDLARRPALGRAS